MFLYFVTLLLIFLAVTIGATIAAFQSVDVIKEPLLKSMDKYDPNSQVPENLDITRAWDDVQREVSKSRKNHLHILPTSLFSSRVAVSIISPIGSRLMVPFSQCLTKTWYRLRVAITTIIPPIVAKIPVAKITRN